MHHRLHFFRLYRRIDHFHLFQDVDIGARSYDEVMQAGIRPGDRVTFDTTFQVLPHQRVMGKAFVDRLGCYLLVTLLRELHDAELPAEVISRHCLILLV